MSKTITINCDGCGTVMDEGNDSWRDWAEVSISCTGMKQQVRFDVCPECAANVRFTLAQPTTLVAATLIGEKA